MMGSITDITQQIYKLQEEYNRLDVRRSKLEAEEEGYRNRLWDEYEMTWSNACELIKDKEVGSLTFRQKKISELKNMIRELGPINVNAIEDYKTTKERYEFLSAQRDDMDQAKLKLEKIISEMTSIMKKQFLQQFELINKSFSDTFKELFDGGRANIVLTDENDVLGCAVDIEVQPPGKKLQNMMLLSGGERAMTAIVLLFSILKLKPSPFCVLDEIEATLDDANVYRFADYVKNFVNRSQFVIITHRKGTMEASDTLYGVTMEEKGVSKVVSMKF
jgi:chromosome segregation protein